MWWTAVQRVCVLYPDDPCGGPAVRACTLRVYPDDPCGGPAVQRVCVLYPDDPCGGPAVQACMCVVSR